MLRHSAATAAGAANSLAAATGATESAAAAAAAGDTEQAAAIKRQRDASREKKVVVEFNLPRVKAHKPN